MDNIQKIKELAKEGLVCENKERQIRIFSEILEKSIIEESIQKGKADVLNQISEIVCNRKSELSGIKELLVGRLEGISHFAAICIGWLDYDQHPGILSHLQKIRNQAKLAIDDLENIYKK